MQPPHRRSVHARPRVRRLTAGLTGALAVALAALSPHAAASGWDAGDVPVVALHYQDLAPGAAGNIVIAIANPGEPDLTDFAAASSDPCLEVGTPYNTASEVWRVPAVATSTAPCRATVIVTASGPDTAWRGAALVAVARVQDAAPLDGATGVNVSYSSSTDRVAVDGSAPTALRREDLIVENTSATPITLLSLSADAALADLVGGTHERRADGAAAPVARPYLPPATELGVIAPGTTRTFGVTVDEPGRLAPGRTAVTLGLLPLLRIGDATYYFEGVVVTLFSSEPAP
ncbi:MAG: hypothetical protein H3C53_10150 [Trueperaceae bacterium]|nr:hypothetical protein [Trueperaceae bacterium]